MLITFVLHCWRYWPRFLGIAVLLVLASAASAITVEQRGNQLLIDGVPTPLTFARGCADVDGLPAYRALGFNTVLVQVNSASEGAIQRAEKLIGEADRLGMFALIELVDGDWAMDRHPCLTDQDYLENARYLLDEAVPRLRGYGSVVGWVISTVNEQRMLLQLDSFAEFLREKYGTVERLNAAWSASGLEGVHQVSRRAKVPSFLVLTEKNALQFDASDGEVRKRIQADIAEYQEARRVSDADFQAYLQERFTDVADVNARWGYQFASWEMVRLQVLRERERAYPGSAPLSQLELARYQAQAPRRLIDWWAQEIRQRDQRHLLFAGCQYSYRTLINLPPSVNGVYTECYPGIAEVDLHTHNPHAIDIARRGNRFIVLAGIQARNMAPAAFAQYLYTAPLHGAAGIGIADWPWLAQSAEHASVVYMALADMGRRHLLGRVPAARAAVVYSPYAKGMPAGGLQSYGYLSAEMLPHPGMCFYHFRQGTSFGQLDYLAAEDLSLVPLAQYRTLLLPAVLDVPVEVQQALDRYVRLGGIAVADVGLGTLQGNGNGYLLPQGMMMLFGVLSMPGVERAPLNLEVYRGHPLLPHLVSGTRTTGISNGFMIARIAKVTPLPGTDLLFTTVASDKPNPPTPRPHVPLESKPTRGMFINKMERGYAIFAPFPLYQFWMPGSMLFGELHRDLFGRQPRIVLEQPAELLPANAAVAAFADDSVAVWTMDKTSPTALLPASGRRVYDTSGGVCEIGPDATRLRYSTAGFHLAEPLPVTVDPLPFVMPISVVQLTPEGLGLDLSPDERAGTSPVTLRIAGGVYPIAPNTPHRVSLVTRTGSHEQVLTADAAGQLVVTLPGTHCRLLISPPDPVVHTHQGQPSRAVPVPEDGGVVIDAVPSHDG
jgi:hypothetical protein